jgi:hypothetical protein
VLRQLIKSSIKIFNLALIITGAGGATQGLTRSIRFAETREMAISPTESGDRAALSDT